LLLRHFLSGRAVCTSLDNPRCLRIPPCQLSFQRFSTLFLIGFTGVRQHGLA